MKKLWNSRSLIRYLSLKKEVLISLILLAPVILFAQKVRNLEDSGPNIQNTNSGSGYFEWDDVQVDGNTISSTDNSIILNPANGNLDLGSSISNGSSKTLNLLGSESKINLILSPKGTGTVQAPDGYKNNISSDADFITKGYFDQYFNILKGDNLGNHTVLQDVLPDINGVHDLGSIYSSFNNIHFKNLIYFGSQPFISHYNNSILIGNGTATVTNGSFNIGIGNYALSSTASFSKYNVAIGNDALRSNTSGQGNVAIGNSTLKYNTAEYNTAIGDRSQLNNTTGSSNTSVGRTSLLVNSTGALNTALGGAALQSNTSGVANTGIGYGSILYNATGNYNTSLGVYAGPAQGASSLDNTTAIGYGATVTESNSVVIGNTSVTSIGGEVSWSTLSDGRFKTEIKDNVPGLEFIKGLKPVSYKVDIDKLNKFLGVAEKEQSEGDRRILKLGLSNTTIGFVAQDVNKLIEDKGYVFSGVDKPDEKDGKYSIRYAEFVVPLTKALQELSVILDDQSRIISNLQEELNQLKSGDNEGLGHNLDIQLFQNRPNPWTVDTRIEMNIHNEIQDARIILYDLKGSEIKNIPIYDRGNTFVSISSDELDPGMYIYTLITDNQVTATKKMILTR